MTAWQRVITIHVGDRNHCCQTGAYDHCLGNAGGVREDRMARMTGGVLVRARQTLRVAGWTLWHSHHAMLRKRQVDDHDMPNSHGVVTAHCRRHAERMKQHSSRPNSPRHSQVLSWRLPGPAGQCSFGALDSVPSAHTQQHADKSHQPRGRLHTVRVSLPRAESGAEIAVRVSGPVQRHGVGGGLLEQVHDPSRSNTWIPGFMLQHHTPIGGAARPDGRVGWVRRTQTTQSRVWGLATGGDSSRAAPAEPTETTARRAVGSKRFVNSTRRWVVQSPE